MRKSGLRAAKQKKVYYTDCMVPCEVSTLYSRSGTRNAHECTLRVNACLSRALTRRACNVLRGTNLPEPELFFLLAIRADAQSFFAGNN